MYYAGGSSCSQLFPAGSPPVIIVVLFGVEPTHAPFIARIGIIGHIAPVAFITGSV
jgi:hypothetical protein